MNKHKSVHVEVHAYMRDRLSVYVAGQAAHNVRLAAMIHIRNTTTAVVDNTTEQLIRQEILLL